MRKLFKCWTFIIVSFVGCTVFAFKEKSQVPGWFLAGSQPESYEIGIENNSERKGKVAYLKSVKTVKGAGFGTIMQNFVPSEYFGKRVKLSGYIKSENVNQWAGMWFRVDGDSKRSLAFDNMQDRPIKGNTTWKRYEIILDVSTKATAIAYGVLLAGPGKVWIDELKFEVVPSNVPVSKESMEKPQNTDFESGN